MSRLRIRRRRHAVKLQGPRWREFARTPCRSEELQAPSKAVLGLGSGRRRRAASSQEPNWQEFVSTPYRSQGHLALPRAVCESRGRRGDTQPTIKGPKRQELGRASSRSQAQQALPNTMRGLRSGTCRRESVYKALYSKSLCARHALAKCSNHLSRA